ncbi:NADH-quinone oxidoreductase subunit C [Actinoplanes sp. NPDC049316]|uniref:NADH-quinone oxidoreductase subunit C n=1 Tax=Actinoplanes sp. NPDC049316 TaxID=3154727 RepID=UPI003419A0DA
MTPEEVGERMVALLTAADTDAPVDPSALTTSVSGGGTGHERAVIDVPPALWWTALRAARDPGALGCDFFDWLSAVDELDEGFTIVAHVWSTRRRHGLLVRTRVPRTDPIVESVVDLYAGAAWHERETHEMFGIGFDRHPNLRPLLLPPEFEGHPLRKEFVLASRVAKAWPGAKEPGESEAGVAKRAPMRPPGVPDPNDWGPLKGKVPPPETPPRRASGDRPARPAGDRPAGDRPARPAGDRPARPTGERPARPAAPPGERSAAGPAGPAARPAPGDRPVRDIPDRATPGAPGDPKAETTPPASGPVTPPGTPDPVTPPPAPEPVTPPPGPPSTPAHAAGAENAAEAADAADAAAAENADTDTDEGKR